MGTANGIISQTMVENIGWTLIHCLWQSVLAAVVLNVIFRLLRNRSSNAKYLSGCAVLLGVVVCAAVTFAIISGSNKNGNTGIIQGNVITTNLIQVDNITTEAAGQINSNLNPEMPTGTIIADSSGQTAMTYVVGAWLAGVLAVSFWYVGGYVQLNTLRWRTVKPVSEYYESLKNRLTEQAAVKRAVTLYESAIVQVPVVIGHIKPVILLPASMLSGMDSQQIEAILAHELAHIRRHDYLVNIFQSLVEILGFYSPAIWWISSKIRQQREHCCDDIAAGLTDSPIQYAKALLRLAEIRQAQYPRAVAANGGDLLGRISRLVGRDTAEKTGAAWLSSALAVAVAVLAIYSSLAVAEVQADKPDTAQAASKTETETKPQLPEKFINRMHELVEDFFAHNYRDITARETIMWGDPVVAQNGYKSIRYKYEATIWGKDKIISDKVFTFDRNNKYVSVEDYDDYLFKNSDAEFYAYKVGTKVSDFPAAEDFSTPQAAYAAINRVMAADDQAGWVRVSESKLKKRLGNALKGRKSNVDPDWAKTVLAANIVEVLVKGNRALILAEFPQDYTQVRDPIDARYLQCEDGKWLNTGEDRFGDLRQARIKFFRNNNIKQNPEKLEYKASGYNSKLIEQVDKPKAETK